MADSEVVTSVCTLLDKNREWLCSVHTRETERPQSSPCLTWESIFPVLWRSGLDSQLRHVFNLKDVVPHLSLICAPMLPSGGTYATSRKSGLLAQSISPPPVMGNLTGFLGLAENQGVHV